MKNRGLLLIALISLTGCMKQTPVTMQLEHYGQSTRVIEKKRPISLPKPKIAATFGYSENPAVLQAYETYTKSGQRPSIQSKGFKTIAYDAYAKPIVECAPFRLCVIQLETGEAINNIELGDSAHWMVHTALIGTKSQGSYQIAIKPKALGMATDMIVTTNHRAYHIGLVSRKGSASHIINFYYPEKSISQTSMALKANTSLNNNEKTISIIDPEKLNFNYQLTGQSPIWRPVRVFDDGKKTYIQMSPQSSQVDLPVLYIRHQGQKRLVNYRYRRPYFIIDGRFKSAALVNGRGDSQETVMIENVDKG